ncbi:hypothetical protein [Streptomyces sp. bgisy153]|uniref:hypothetical protein n=1 Tax=Streptomyces sp. bgisy153 TaxID=3413793 RepID=UPI003D709326
MSDLRANDTETERGGRSSCTITPRTVWHEGVEHRPVKDGSRVESGFLGPFTSRRHQRRFAGLDTATGGLPEPRSVERVPPVQKKQAVGGVKADDPGGGPVRSFHRPDAMPCSKCRSRTVLIDISSDLDFA